MPINPADLRDVQLWQIVVAVAPDGTLIIPINGRLKQSINIEVMLVAAGRDRFMIFTSRNDQQVENIPERFVQFVRVQLPIEISGNA